jgi:hypothetical protein
MRLKLCATGPRSAIMNEKCHGIVQCSQSGDHYSKIKELGDVFMTEYAQCAQNVEHCVPLCWYKRLFLLSYGAEIHLPKID